MAVLTPKQEAYARKVNGICRAVWNVGLEQRREYRRRGGFIDLHEQTRQMVAAKPSEPWLTEAPSHCLQQVLRNLDRACKKHGTYKVHWKSARRSKVSLQFPDPARMVAVRLGRHWGQVKLPKFGWVRFRWSRPIGGRIKNAALLRHGGRWYVSFCVDDGEQLAPPNGRPPVGVDRGVAIAVATSDGWMRTRAFSTPGEVKRLRRLNQQLGRRKKGSGRQKASRAKLLVLNARIHNRRVDFYAWTANRLTGNHGRIVLEDLRIRNMAASAKGTAARPGRNVRQKAGLNRSIMDQGWYGFGVALRHKARYSGSEIVKIHPAYTSQTCSACGHVDPKSRESQARFVCTACGHAEHADVNAAKNILAAGLAVTGCGDLCGDTSGKRQPPVRAVA